MTTKLDLSWKKLFDKYNILEEVEEKGFYIITADQIREFREPRLMTKFDHNEDLPILFKESNLSIMPISRSEYYISHNKMFSHLDEKTFDVESFPLPNYIESITKENITSEAIALNCSYLTGMISDFVEDTNVFPTVSGKMSSRKFSYQIENLLTKKFDTINVNNSMIEIDGAYEGNNYLTIVEAKQTLCDNFLIRQLYYPYRVWKNRIKKNIKLVYFVYSNDIFSFFEYKFKDFNNYNSLELVKQKNYTLEDLTITSQDILDILNDIQIVQEPKVPFPQADSFNRIINMCNYLNDDSKSKEDITIDYAFDRRQADYYTNAGKYLGLFENIGVHVYTTPLCKKILKMSYKQRQLSFVKLVLKHEIFKWALNKRITTAKPLNKNEIIAQMKESNLYNVTKNDTYVRRSSTIIRWIEWIMSLIKK